MKRCTPPSAAKKPTLRQLFSRPAATAARLWLSVCIAFLTGEWLIAPVAVACLPAEFGPAFRRRDAGAVRRDAGADLLLCRRPAPLRHGALSALERAAAARPRGAAPQPRAHVGKQGGVFSAFRSAISAGICWKRSRSEALPLFWATAPSPHPCKRRIYGFLTYTCTAFLSSYVSAGGFAFFRDLGNAAGVQGLTFDGSMADAARVRYIFSSKCRSESFLMHFLGEIIQKYCVLHAFPL